MYEETGLIAKKLDFFKIYSGRDMIHTYPNGDEAYIIGIIMICENYTGELTKENDETLELKWFDINEQIGNISPLTKRPLNDFIEYIKERDKI